MMGIGAVFAEFLWLFFPSLGNLVIPLNIKVERYKNG
jgi:hypothetical protein